MVGEDAHEVVDRVVDGAECAAEREVDDVEPVVEIAVAVRVEGPVEAECGERRRAGAAEDPDRVELRARRGARADAHAVELTGA